MEIVTPAGSNQGDTLNSPTKAKTINDQFPEQQQIQNDQNEIAPNEIMDNMNQDEKDGENEDE